MPRHQRSRSTPNRGRALAGLALAAASAGVLYVARDPALSARLRVSAFANSLGAWLDPIAIGLLIGGVVWAWMALRARRPAGSAARGRPGTAAQAIEDMTPREFEAQLGEAFRLQGYQITKGDGNGSAGVDLILRKDRETVLVHTGRWRAERVGAEPLGSLQKSMSARSATGGIVVTAGRFSREATAFARQANLNLIDGPVLLGMLMKARSARPSGSATPTSGGR